MSSKFRSITLISSPYHLGLPNVGPGAGPTYLLSRGLAASLKALGIPLHEVEIEAPNPGQFEGEIGRSFEVLRRTAKLVAQARRGASFPIILAASSEPEEIGCVWFDAHDDFNTPDTVISGYFDSMAIAMLAGQCWRGLLATVAGHQPMDLARLVHVGMRDVTEVERTRVLEAGFDVVWGNQAAAGLAAEAKVDFVGGLGRALERKKLGPTMVHLDLDCLDSSLGKVNKFASPRGLFEEDLYGCLEKTVTLAEPLTLTVASFDPSCDEQGAETIAKIAIGAVSKFVASLVSAGMISQR
ncbi:Arginase [Madurella mycetomatis]|uniref:Arginase n=1 Tax=Madurella mycetomatis TaxID=100816 RepID=A0A175W7F7_9PEZI|nr:Arginase [Madurella mycetomatis]